MIANIDVASSPDEALAAANAAAAKLMQTAVSAARSTNQSAAVAIMFSTLAAQLINITLGAVSAAAATGGSGGGGSPPEALVIMGLSALASLATSSAAVSVNALNAGTAILHIVSNTNISPTPLPSSAAVAALKLLTAAVVGSNGTGGVAAAAANNFVDALVASSLRGSTSPTMDISSVPINSNPLTPDCSPSVSLSVIRIPIGSIDASRRGSMNITLARPLPYCGGAAAAAAGLPTNPLGVTLPSALIASQPAPLVSIPFSTLATMTGPGSPLALAALKAGSTTVDFRLVQWGVAPMNTVVGADIVYEPLAESGGVTPPSSSPTKRRLANDAAPTHQRVLSLLDSVYSSVASAFADAPSLGDGAVSAARDQLRASTPQPVSVKDLLPARPLDSRVLSVTVSSGGEAPASTSTLIQPTRVYRITVPLRDLSIVAFNVATGKVDGVEIGQSSHALLSPVFNVSCPAENARSDLAVGSLLSAIDVSTSPAKITSVSVMSSSLVKYGILTADVYIPDGDGAADAMSGIVGGRTSLSADGSVSNVTVGRYFVILAANCGVSYGDKQFVCGPGTGGQIVQYKCPRAVPTASCLYFDSLRSRWTSDGCVIDSVADTSVDCACDRLADFGTRYAALPLANTGIFAVASSRLSITKLPSAALLYTIIAILLSAAACSGACGRSALRTARAHKYSSVLAFDCEIQTARRISDLLSGPTAWIHDREYSLYKVTGPTTKVATVAPVMPTLSAGDFLSPPPPALVDIFKAQRVAFPQLSESLLVSLEGRGGGGGDEGDESAQLMRMAVLSRALRAHGMWQKPVTKLETLSAPSLFAATTARIDGAHASPHWSHFTSCGRNSSARFTVGDYASSSGGVGEVHVFHSALGGLAIAAFLYSWGFQIGGGFSLSSLSMNWTFIVGLASASAGCLYGAFLHSLAAYGAYAYAAWRWPSVSEEIVKRAAFSRALEWSGEYASPAAVNLDAARVRVPSALPAALGLDAVLARLDAARVRVPLPRFGDRDDASPTPASLDALVSWLIYGAYAPLHEPFVVLFTSPVASLSPAAALALVDAALAKRRKYHNPLTPPPSAFVAASLIPWILTLWCSFYSLAFGLRHGGWAANTLVAAWVVATVSTVIARPFYYLVIECTMRAVPAARRGTALAALEMWTLPAAAALAGGPSAAPLALAHASVRAAAELSASSASAHGSIALALPQLFLLSLVEAHLGRVDSTFLLKGPVSPNSLPNSDRPVLITSSGSATPTVDTRRVSTLGFVEISDRSSLSSADPMTMRGSTAGSMGSTYIPQALPTLNVGGFSVTGDERSLAAASLVRTIRTAFISTEEEPVVRGGSAAAPTLTLAPMAPSAPIRPMLYPRPHGLNLSMPILNVIGPRPRPLTTLFSPGIPSILPRGTGGIVMSPVTSSITLGTFGVAGRNALMPVVRGSAPVIPRGGLGLHPLGLVVRPRGGVQSQGPGAFVAKNQPRKF